MAKNGDRVEMLYAFDGISENHELTLSEGDFVTITDADVGEGWFEGQDANGTVGLFPSGYAQVVPDAGFENGTDAITPTQQQDLMGSFAPSQDNAGYQGDDYADDDWEASWGAQAVTPAAVVAPTTQIDRSASQKSTTSVAKVDGDSPKKSGKGGLFGGLFSSFSSTPSEAFVAGESDKVDTSGKPRIILTMTDGLPMWEYSNKHFTCVVSDPQKASKFSGLKSYITYNITPDDTGKTVTRRYKHFDWLLEQLTKKFSTIISIPPLPDKQITGRYEDEFIENRRQQLHTWIARMSLHPVVADSEVFQHFLRSKDSEKAWKDGKRKAESDVAVGGALCSTITPLEQYRIELADAEATLQLNTQFTKNLDDALKQMTAHGAEYARKCAGPLTREYQRTGQCFGAIANAFALDTRETSVPLTNALQHTGIISCFPNILGNNKSGIDKQKEIQKLHLEGKCTSEDVDNAKLRAETLSYAVQAEVNHMQHYRVGDFTEFMRSFTQQQVVFYQNIVAKLQETASLYENLQ